MAIAPWAQDKGNRLNPRNGLCLNTLHNRAFDRRLITVTSDYRVRVSLRLLESEDEPVRHFFRRYQDVPIRLPRKF